MSHTPTPWSIAQSSNPKNTYPQLVEALQRCIAALAANGAPNCEAVKEAKAALTAAEKGA